MRGSSSSNPVQASEMNYNIKLKSFSSYFLSNFPGFKKKPAEPVVVTQRSDGTDPQHPDYPRRSLQNTHDSKYSKHPPLIPSSSDSKLVKSAYAGRRASRNSRKIIAVNNGNINTDRNNESPNKLRSNNKTTSGTKMFKHNTSTGIDITGKYHQQQHQQSYTDHSSSSTATSASAIDQYQASPRYNRISSTGKSVISSNGGSDPYSSSYSNSSKGGSSSLLSQIGFGKKTKTATSNGVTTPSGSTTVVHVKPVDSFADSNPMYGNSSNNTSNSTSTSKSYATSTSVNYNYNRTPPTTSPSTVSANSQSTYSPASKPLPLYPSSSANSPFPGLLSTTTSSTTNSNKTPSTVSNTATTSSSLSTPNPKKTLCCDKCDGKHMTDSCPYFKKNRENHPDAQKNDKQIGGVSALPGSTLYSARIVKQPGDGSCLFHSMSYGLQNKLNANKLRTEICTFIQNNPNLKISDTPLQDWVKWDSNGASVSEYARKMSRGSWGGGIEMACVSQVSFLLLTCYRPY